jgi:hypothetical protein
MALTWPSGQVLAGDYNQRFRSNYPPGYYGMWYYANRFHDRKLDNADNQYENYRWDRYMSKIIGLEFPWYPIPFDWEYGSKTNFNLPDYNSNDWH